MNTKRLYEEKKALREEMGSAYPTCREDLTYEFLFKFGAYVPGVDEDEDFEKYEESKYASEQWAYFYKLSEGIYALQEKAAAGKATCENYLQWVVDNYFPEFA